MSKFTMSHYETMYALCDMWTQYCPPPWTHSFMSAGEGAERVLLNYNLLFTRGDKRGQIKYNELEKLRKLATSNELTNRPTDLKDKENK